MDKLIILKNLMKFDLEIIKNSNTIESMVERAIIKKYLEEIKKLEEEK